MAGNTVNDSLETCIPVSSDLQGGLDSFQNRWKEDQVAWAQGSFPVAQQMLLQGEV